MDASKGGQSEVARMIWTVCTPIIFTLGIVGNALTIIVLNHRTTRSSTTVYLTTLAIMDFLFILVGIPRWMIIYNFAYDIRHINKFVCKAHWYVMYSSGATSTILLIVLTSERILSTAKPYTVKTYCSVKRSVIIAGSLILLVCVINSHVLFGFDLREFQLITNNATNDVNQINGENKTNIHKIKSCTWTFDDNYRIFYEQYFIVIIFVLQHVIPQVFIVTGGIYIVLNLVKNNRLRKGLDQRSRSYESRTSTVTNMLLMINLAYIILETPMQIFMIGRPYWVGEQMTSLQEVVWAIVNLLNYLNRAINFILYFLSGTRFRNSFLEFITCKRSRPTAVGNIARVEMPRESVNGVYSDESLRTSPI